jgi:hypothetical protein
LLDRAHLSPDARSRLSQRLPKTRSASINATLRTACGALGEIGDIWPDSIFADGFQ